MSTRGMMRRSLLAFVISSLFVNPSVMPSKIGCSVDDLRKGLRCDGNEMKLFEIDESIDVRCYEIYTEADTTITCLPDGTWGAEYPRCLPITCPSPKSPPQAYLKFRSEVGEMATVTCPEGFWYSGTNPRVCQRNRTWTGEEGQCIAVQCSALPPPLHGHIQPGPPYGFKGKITVSCDAGFAYTGSPEMLCQVNNMWLGILGICIDIISISCKLNLPDGAITASLKTDVAKYQEKTHVTCRKGFTYNGTGARTCQADGTWSGSPGTCNAKTCESLNQILDPETVQSLKAVLHTSNGQIETKYKGYMVGDTVQPVCSDGFSYNGSKLVCTEEGTWDGTKGSCIASPCNSQPSITDGVLDRSDAVFQDLARITCNTGYRWEGFSPHAVCRNDGSWETNGACKPVPCQQDPRIENGELDGSGHVFLDTANINCQSGYRWDGSSPNAVCQNDGSWKIHGECEEIKSEVHLGILILCGFILGAVVIALLFLIIQRRRRKRRESQGHTDSNDCLLEDTQGDNSDSLKRNVRYVGHVINREHDKLIDLDSQFVKIRLVTEGGLDRMDDINNWLPDHYQDYLQRSGAENIEMEDILDHIQYDCGMSKRKALLLVGRAGVGKSTLVQKMMRLWAQNKWAKDFKAAFLFNIRNLIVPDKRPISLIDLFMSYSVYISRGRRQYASYDWHVEDEGRTLIFLDGVDEFPNLGQSLKHIRNLKVNSRAEAIEWCLSLLRRQVMGKSVLILTSRSYKDLRHLNCSPVIEVVGLIRETIMDFIDHHVAADNIARVREAMTSNPLVMSVSSITYFCMMFTRILEEDERASTAVLTTYTRIAAFFTQFYMSRCRSSHKLCPDLTNMWLPPLAKLAYRGLVERQQMSSRVRLVFDKTDLKETGVTDDLRMEAEKSGILVTSRMNTADISNETDTVDMSHVSEFVHLSIQELLAMLELCTKTHVVARNAAASMWSSGSFLMAQQYLFGLCYDDQSETIQNLCEMIGEAKGQKRPELIKDLIKRLLEFKDCPDINSKLQTIQIVYETQRPDVTRDVSQVLFAESGELCLSNTLLTVIDINAIIFMLSHTDKACYLRLDNISWDTTSAVALTKGLKKCQTLIGFSMMKTKLSATEARRLLKGFPRFEKITRLELDDVGLETEIEKDLTDALQGLENINKLSLVGSKWSENGFQNFIKVLRTREMLTNLNLANTGLNEEMIRRVKDDLYTIMARLTTLRLDNNKIARPGIQVIAESLTGISLLQELSLANTKIGYDSAQDLMNILAKNKVMKKMDIRGEKIEDPRDLMGILKNNTTLEAIWLTDRRGDTKTVVRVPGTGRRMTVSAAPHDTQLYAWSVHDVATLRHEHVVWSETSTKLRLKLEDVFTDLYGDARPIVNTDTWCQTIRHLTQHTHRFQTLVLYLSKSAPLSPLLTYLSRDVLRSVIESKVERLKIYNGHISCSSLLSWLQNPAWTVSRAIKCAKLTNKEGESVMIGLQQPRITGPCTQEEYLTEKTKLLYQAVWVKGTEKQQRDTIVDFE